MDKLKNKIKELQIEYAELCDMGEYVYANQAAKELKALESLLATAPVSES